MTTITPSSEFIAGLVAVPAGVAFGLAYFRLLRRSARLLAAGEGKRLSIAYAVGRLGAAVALFFVAARLGAWPLLAFFAGFLVAREIALRPERRSS